MRIHHTAQGTTSESLLPDALSIFHMHLQVHSLVPDGPADKCGQIAVGDRLLEVEGTSIDLLSDSE
jgi:C-terminal processing protease CtpA/Prc